MAPGARLFGRDADLAALATALERDRATVVLGEAGIGKTALVRAAAAAGDRALHEGGAFATLRATPYVALRGALDVGLRGDPATVAAQVERAIGPDLLFVDDVQWADEATLAALGLLAGRIALVAAVRALDPGAARALDALVSAGAAVHEVAPLPAPAARELVAVRRPDLPPRVVDDIVARAAGNPLLLEELADRGEVSSVLGRALTARLDQLSGGGRGVVELLAIAERPLPRAVLPADEAGALEEALRAGIVVEREGAVEVRHQLVGDAVRERLAEPDRQRLHLRVAELTTERAAAARHLAAGGRPDDAARLALDGLADAADPRDRAALLAIAAEASPPDVALAMRLDAARALDEVSDWPGVTAVLGPLAGDGEPELVAEGQAVLAHAAFALGDIGTSRARLAATEGLAVSLGSAAAARCAIERATHLVNVDGRVEQAIAELDAAAAALPARSAEAEDVAELRAEILLLATGVGDAGHVRSAADRAFDAGRYRTATDRSRVVQYFLNMAVGSEAALEYLLERHARYDAAGIGSMAQEFLADAVVAAFVSGRLHDAVTIADRLLETPVSPRPRQMAGIYRARALVLLGRSDEAERTLEGLRPTVSPDFFGLGQLLLGLAEAAFWGGRPDLARQRAEAALAVPAPLPVAQVEARVALAWARHDAGLATEPGGEVAHTPSTAGAPFELEALAAAATGDVAAAAASFAAAGDAWSRFHEPRTLVCRWAAAEARGRTGDAAAATAELRAALDAAEAMGFEPLAARIRRSLRLLGVRVASARATPRPPGAGLTARELELVALVERGLTNVEIARRLGLGRPTVARILGSAMSKLGVGSRAELAAKVPRDRAGDATSPGPRSSP